MTELSRPGPAHAAAAMMRALFGSKAARAHAGLADFQSDAVVRLTKIIDRFGGALLCDSVGLGKTHIASEIIAAEASNGAAVLVIAPAQLHSMWSRQLRAVPDWRWLSHTQLSRRATADRLRHCSFHLIVVDEAHAFRNAATRRYRALARLASGSRLLLITATPVNNSLSDFYNLLRLFAADDAFISCGVPDLRAEIEAATTGRTQRLRRVARLVMVRRTRDDVRAWTDASHRTPQSLPDLRFPRSSTTTLIEYDLDAVYAGHLRLICELLSTLRFAPYAAASHTTTPELSRLGLVKRLESGIPAFDHSVIRLLRATELFRSAAQNGLLFSPVRDAALALPIDGALQLTLERVALPPWPECLDRSSAIERADRDLDVLHRIRRAVHAARQNGDPKQRRLLQLVADELRDERVVVFTEYRATAESLHRALEHCGGSAFVHGGEARLGRRGASRRAVIDRFAPVANHAKQPRAIEAVRILIATDVLAEGVNLQDARVLVSYDLPWNPVRLAQRAGRIDRLGSPHTSIDIRAFRPVRDTEAVLGLMRRIRAKVRDIRIVGGDAPAPFAGERRAAARVFADPASAIRERLRIDFLHSSTDLPPARRAVAYWNRPPATLCCVHYGGDAVLVLVESGRVIDIDGVAAWEALRQARDQLENQPLTGVDASFVAGTEAAAVRAVTAAATRKGDSAPAGSRRDALRLLKRWLRSRPGGPAPTEFELADAAFALLRRPLAAGAELELADALKDDPDSAVRRLAKLTSQLRSAEPPPPSVLASVLFRPK